jgi:hypothetical protein
VHLRKGKNALPSQKLRYFGHTIKISVGLGFSTSRVYHDTTMMLPYDQPYGTAPLQEPYQGNRNEHKIELHNWRQPFAVS